MDDSEGFEASSMRLLEILFDHPDNVPGRDRVQVQNIFNRQGIWLFERRHGDKLALPSMIHLKATLGWVARP